MDPKPIVLSDYDPVALAEAGAVLELADEHGRPTGAKITLKGADSDTYQDAARDQQRKRSAAMTKNRRFGFKMPTPEELEADAIDLLAIATQSWDGIQSAPGVSMPCTVENARALYRKRPDIREQADAFVNERLNFLPSAAGS